MESRKNRYRRPTAVLFNIHTHSEHSHDAQAKIDDLCEEAIRKDLIGFAVTDRDFKYEPLTEMQVGQDAITFKIYRTPSETQPVISTADGAEAKKIENVYVTCLHFSRLK